MNPTMLPACDAAAHVNVGVNVTCWQCLHVGCWILIIRLCCACKHSRIQRAKKCYSPVVSESALKIGSFATFCCFWAPPQHTQTQTYTHTCLYYSFEHLIQRRQCQRVRQMWGIPAHFYKVSCESFFSLSLSFVCLMFDLKLDVTAFECFREMMAQSRQFKVNTGIYRSYNKQPFPPNKVKGTLLFGDLYVYEKQ